MEKKPGSARHLARRLHIRRGIPSCVELPKFMTPAEVEQVINLKKERPGMLWDDAIREIIMKSFESRTKEQKEQQ